VWVLFAVTSELITRPEESYVLWCVVACDLETSWMRRPLSNGGLSRQKQTNNSILWRVFLTMVSGLLVLFSYVQVYFSVCLPRTPSIRVLMWQTKFQVHRIQHVKLRHVLINVGTGSSSGVMRPGRSADHRRHPSVSAQACHWDDLRFC